MISLAVMIAGLVFIAMGKPLTRTYAQGEVLFPFIMLFLFLMPAGIVMVIISIKIKKAQNLAAGIGAALFYGIGVLCQGLFSIEHVKFDRILDLTFWFELLTIPFLYITILFSIAGFFFQQVGANRIHLPVIYSICYPLSEIIVLVGSIVLFGDNLSPIQYPFRFTGTMLALAGFILVIITQRSSLIKNVVLRNEA